ncbi:hypothetical protein TRVA0_002S00804 [Trichomonascus vanleenenianus]|uniref:uncharacterized protein n=1 Tax=Trichomonascus vanleenenianus TaxID=2268995 RepID=UPI003ECB9B27
MNAVTIEDIVVIVVLLLLTAVYNVLWLVGGLVATHWKSESQAMANWFFWRIAALRLQVNLYGDDILEGESALVLSNHVSRLDYAVLASIANLNGLRGRFSFFVWKRFMKIPDLELAKRIMTESSNWTIDASELVSDLLPVFKSTKPYWTIMFPEVNVFTGVTKAKDNQSMENYHHHHKRHEFRNVLPPRLIPIIQVLPYLRTCGVAHVYDVTISYRRDTARHVVDVHVSRIAMKAVPKRPRAAEKWLEKLWIDKDIQMKKIPRKKSSRWKRNAT